MNVKELIEKIESLYGHGPLSNKRGELEALLTEAHEAFLEEQLNKAGHWIKTEDYREEMARHLACTCGCHTSLNNFAPEACNFWHRDECIEMAKQLREVAAKEREACAKVIEAWTVWTPDHIGKLAAQIRRRGEK